MDKKEEGDPLVEELNRRGREVVGELYGDKYDNVIRLFERLDKRLVDHAVGFTYGNVYPGMGLEPRTRELIMVAVLAAMNYPEQMVTHVMAAQNVGATEQDIRDTLVLLTSVAGIPCVIEGLRRADKVFERKEER